MYNRTEPGNLFISLIATTSPQKIMEQKNLMKTKTYQVRKVQAKWGGENAII